MKVRVLTHLIVIQNKTLLHIPHTIIRLNHANEVFTVALQNKEIAFFFMNNINIRHGSP